jgi:hypothetical protein
MAVFGEKHTPAYATSSIFSTIRKPACRIILLDLNMHQSKLEYA